MIMAALFLAIEVRDDVHGETGRHASKRVSETSSVHTLSIIDYEGGVN